MIKLKSHSPGRISFFFFFFFYTYRENVVKIECTVYVNTVQSGVRGMFFRGGKVTFPDFFPFFPARNTLFPVEIFRFGTPQINFKGFEK